MFALLAALIPGLLTLTTAITTAAFNTKVSLVQARLNVDRDVAVKTIQAAAQADHENTSRLAIMSGNKILTILLVMFAIPLIAFEWKVILIDKVFKLGTTDALQGEVATWANTIVAFLFGSSTAVTLGKMWYGRPGAVKGGE
jgi:hypothetical protein